jgi:cysteine sulfinate desulfinase/cysteine desulfurase-like protein
LEHIGSPRTSSFRIGLGSSTTEDHVEALLDALPELVGSLRAVAERSERELSRFRDGPR